jgi:predicted permease
MIWARIRSLASALWRRSRLENEMADELDFHIASRADDLMARHGLDRGEAMRRARLEFGSLDKYKEEGREARGLGFFDALRADFRYSLGQLRKYPIFTATAVLTIALGVAVNAATFNILNASLFKPLPARDPEQLTRLATLSSTNPVPNAQLAFPDYRDLKDGSEAFEDVAAWSNEFHGLNVDGRTDRVITSAITGNFFAMLGVQPMFGRLIRPADGDLGGREPVLVLGYSYWANRLAKDPSVVGKQVKLSGQPFTVIGVVPDEFHGADNLIEFDAYLPLELSLTSPFLANRNMATVRAIARLKPGMTVQRAQAALDTISWRLQTEYPDSNANRTISVFPERRSRPDPALVSVMPTVVVTLLSLSGAVLLIASVNVLSLLLARGLARRGEMAIRAALGANRWQLVRVCFSEAILIAVLGGVLGVIAAAWITGLLATVRPRALAGVALRMNLDMDWRVVLYATILIAITAVVVGLIPALRSARTIPNRDLHSSKVTGAPQRQRLRRSLVVVQLAVSVAFLVVAGMFVQSLYNLQSLDLGFHTGHLLLVDVDPATGGYDGLQMKSLFTSIETRLSAVPGIQSVSRAALRPFGDSMLGAGVLAEGQTSSSNRELVDAEANIISPHYFETMEIPLLRGRDFQESDGPSSRIVAIVSDTLAAQLWPNEDAIGKRLKTTVAPDLMLEVVGIVKASKQSYGLQPRKPAPPQLFVPAGQAALLGRTMPIAGTFYIRTRIPPESLAAAVQSEIRSVDANVAVNNLATMDAQVRQSLNGFGLARAAVAISASVGVLALLLALVGTYGSLSWMVGQRVQEIGVRIALGANREAVLRMIVFHGLKLAALGAVVGVLAGGAIGRLLQIFLFDVSPLDPLVLIPVVLLLLGTAFMTCMIPARRATKIDPILALRCE